MYMVIDDHNFVICYIYITITKDFYIIIIYLYVEITRENIIFVNITNSGYLIKKKISNVRDVRINLNKI